MDSILSSGIMIMLLFAASSLMEQGGVGVGVIRHPGQVRAHHLVRVLEDPEGLLQLGEDEDSVVHIYLYLDKGSGR